MLRCYIGFLAVSAIGAIADLNPVKASPEDFEKLLCKFASQKQIEDKAIDEVCSLIEQKIPSLKKVECVAAADVAWDKIVAMCPKGNMMFKTDPTSDIEKLVCKFATQKQIEDKAIDEVCSLIEQKIPSVKKAECVVAAGMAWDKIAAMCPKGNMMFKADPTSDIEKLVCKFATQKQIEDKAIDEVCSLIEQKIPSVKKAECVFAAGMAWDKIAAMCPKGNMMFKADPTSDIEKLVCKFATQKQIEDKAVDEVCSLIEQKIPSVKKAECVVAAGMAWDKIAAMCPKGNMMFKVEDWRREKRKSQFMPKEKPFVIV